MVFLYFFLENNVFIVKKFFCIEITLKIESDSSPTSLQINKTDFNPTPNFAPFWSLHTHSQTRATVMLIHVSHMTMKKCESHCLSAADFILIKLNRLFEKNIFSLEKKYII